MSTDTSTGNYAKTTLTGDGVTILADRNTAGPALTNQFDTLTTNGAYTLNITGGSNVTSGTAQVNFNATTLGGNATFNVVNPAAGSTVMSIGGAIGESGGARSLTKTGNGTLTLGGVSTFTGGTTVNGGEVILANGAAGGTTRIRGALTVNSGATVTTTGDATGLGWVDQITSVAINNGTITSTGAMHIWNITGGITMTGGTLQSNGGVSTTSGNQLEWNRTSVATLASANTATIAGRINIRSDNSYTTVPFTVADGSASRWTCWSAPPSPSPRGAWAFPKPEPA
ncbi:MAG: autotransporter-associated beta strand repeat-containing protein [Kiritimatiellia bacterium]